MAELLRMEDEEEQRLANEVQVNASLPVELEHDENTPWLRQCGWPRWFARRPLHVIAATSQLPSRKHKDLYLGAWNGTELISYSSTEGKLLKLVDLASCVDLTMQKHPNIPQLNLGLSTGLHLAFQFARIHQ
ncbi:hypothetical protein GQ44DRAFT_779550 [Phaeosphaeriaceae sp. PMI808]|nr:hypothetical protein GQ44DRAFT_779550 [Phaeosphaeriaceae sp. PMI808]